MIEIVGSVVGVTPCDDMPLILAGITDGDDNVLIQLDRY
jgi:hypothetical protein